MQHDQNQKFIPLLVRQAEALADEMGFAQSCTPAVGRLLRALAGQFHRGVIGEIGTGCGVGSAWIASALSPTASFVTVELDAARAAGAQALFAGCPNVRVLQADWHAILEYGPFVMLFADGAKAKQREPETVLRALAPGGLLVLDDLTPEERWPEAWRGRRDPVRQFWLNKPSMAACEVLVAPDSAVILAARIA